MPLCKFTGAPGSKLKMSWEMRSWHGWHVYNQFVIRAKRSDELKAYLKSHQIGSEIYLPPPPFAFTGMFPKFWLSYL